jgi:hypothetical protein
VNKKVSEDEEIKKNRGKGEKGQQSEGKREKYK